MEPITKICTCDCICVKKIDKNSAPVTTSHTQKSTEDIKIINTTIKNYSFSEIKERINWC